MGLLLEQEYEDCEVIAVSSSNKAVALIRDLTFDLYILDFRLPGLSGVDLCRLIRENGRSQPVMFFSAMARPSDRKAAMNAGANAYLVKPNDLDRLTQTVRRLLEESILFPAKPIAA
jgi:OmpR-family two-component system manganese-sensing response regulator